MPIYEVNLVAYCTVLISAENEDDAGIYALSCTPISAYGPESGEVKGVVSDDDLDAAKRNADYVDI